MRRRPSSVSRAKGPTEALASQKPGSASANGIAVVVIAYGAHDPLLRCIESIAGQSNAKAARLIVVDNNPPEARCDAVRVRAAAGAEVDLQILVPGTNLGYGRAVNLALDQIQEEFVLVSNPDLILEANLLARLGEEIRTHPGAAAVGPRLASADGTTPAKIPARPPGLRDEIAWLAGFDRIFRTKGRQSTNRDATQSVAFLSGACFLARRQALSEVGGFDPRFFLYYEDADLFRRLRAAGWELLLVPAAAVHHDQRGTWSDPVRRQAASIRSGILYHRKHGGRLAEFTYRIGLLLLYAPRLLLGGFVLWLLGRKPVFTLRDRFRMLGRTIQLAFSTTRPEQTPERRQEADRP